MKLLSKGEIQEILKGIVNVEEGDKGLSLYRFPKSILDVCKKQSEEFRIRTHSNVGAMLDFFSDTSYVVINAIVAERGARNYCFFDIWIDGVFVNYTGTEESGEQKLEITFDIGTSGEEHHIQIYLPHTREVFIESISVSDKAKIRAVAPKASWLAYGDSITQGMNATHPSLCYVATAARLMNVDAFNAGVGGAHFDKVFLKEKFVDDVDLITVAFGTNDWSANLSSENARDFLQRLTLLYPKNKVYVLSPIWRSADLVDFKIEPGKISLEEYRKSLRIITSQFDNCYFIEKESLHPAGMNLISDGIHPDPPGQIVYGINLAVILKQLSS